MNLIYIRTSSEDQNPENQLKDIYSLGLSKETLVYEEKQSAWKEKERPIFNKVRILIKEEKITDLYVWDWDRIYRNRKKLKEFFAFCKLYKCKVHSYRQGWYEKLNQIPEPFNEIVVDLMLNLMGWLAEDESKKKSERIKASVRRKDGTTLSYKGNKWGRKPLPKQTRDRILALHKEGKSIREIATIVKTTDANNHMKSVSRGVVHKIINVFNQKLKEKELNQLQS